MRFRLKDLLVKIFIGGLLLLCTNLNIIFDIYQVSIVQEVIVHVIAIVFIIIFAIYPINDICTARLKVMQGGRNVFTIACCCIFIENILYIMLMNDKMCSDKTLIINGIIAFVTLFFLAVEGIFRIILTSKQVGIVYRVLFFIVWWIPFVNVIVCFKISKKAKLEYIITKERIELDKARANSQVCQTKYPIVMVHGVFFRDWQYFNYWGRISKRLIQNGATIHYGKQQSACSVEDSAKELANQIESIIKETGCEKVNIIAHSKGGLDTRYAISNCGMDKYVASLITINTPHLGCIWADELLKKIPAGFVNFVAKRYNKMFTKLGDNKPDFISAVNDLTFANCTKLNEMMPDKEGILYQAYMSKMNSSKSAGVPLCFLYPLVKRYEKDNDGLVSVTSGSAWHFVKLLTVEGKRGISHGDVIDLMREDIKGFDVSEFFVDVVSELKKEGL